MRERERERERERQRERKRELSKVPLEQNFRVDSKTLVRVIITEYCLKSMSEEITQNS